MAENNLKDFAINWIVIGLLFFSLLSFAVVFMFNNNPNYGLNDGADLIFNNAKNQLSPVLSETEQDTNALLNVTANTNPEASFLGSRDSVATSYSITGVQKSTFQTAKPFILWIFSGALGQLLLAVMAGILSILAIYFITKWIRQGG